jgi:hypothetical protein
VESVGGEEIGDGGAGERVVPRLLHRRPSFVSSAGVACVARPRTEQASRVRPRLVEAVDDAGQGQLVGRVGESESAQGAARAVDDPRLG